MTRKRKIAEPKPKRLENGIGQSVVQDLDSQNGSENTLNESDVNMNLTKKGTISTTLTETGVQSTPPAPPIQKVRKPRRRSQNIPQKSPRLTRSRTVNASKGLIPDKILIVALENSDNSSPMGPGASKKEDMDNPVKPRAKAKAPLPQKTNPKAKKNKEASTAVENPTRSPASQEPEPEPVTEEVSVPPEGAVYESGLVWEFARNPTLNGNAAKSILKLSNPIERRISGASDVSDAPIASKKTKGNISFSPEPHHVRFFHSPARKSKKKPGSIFRKIIRQRAIQKRAAVTSPWNPKNAVIEFTDAAEAITKDTASGSGIPRLFKENSDGKNSNSNGGGSPIFKFGSGVLPSRRIDFSVDLALDPAAGDTQGFDLQLASTDSVSSELAPGSSELASTLTSDTQQEQRGRTDSDSTYTIDSLENDALTQDILGSGELSDQEPFVNPEHGNYDPNPFCPELIYCNDPIPTSVIQKIALPGAAEPLVEIMESIGICTIGTLSRQSEIDILKWPIIQPKVKTMRDVLSAYRPQRMKTNIPIPKAKATASAVPVSVEDLFKKLINPVEGGSKKRIGPAENILKKSADSVPTKERKETSASVPVLAPPPVLVPLPPLAPLLPLAPLSVPSTTIPDAQEPASRHSSTESYETASSVTPPIPPPTPPPQPPAERDEQIVIDEMLRKVQTLSKDGLSKFLCQVAIFCNGGRPEQ